MSIHIRDPKQQARGCLIWMHGLGADASDMMGLANELQINQPVRHVFLDAPVRPVTLNNGMPMRAWYDILGMNLADREDRVGILSSEALIRDVLEKQILDGFSSDTIFLAGFSQGAAMALFSGLRTLSPLAGIIALSGYLPLASDVSGDCNLDTPIFMAAGEYDTMVLPLWTGMCIQYLSNKGYQNITSQRYPMDHSICMEEIQDLGQWISTVLKRKELK